MKMLLLRLTLDCADTEASCLRSAANDAGYEVSELRSPVSKNRLEVALSEYAPAKFDAIYVAAHGGCEGITESAQNTQNGITWETLGLLLKPLCGAPSAMVVLGCCTGSCGAMNATKRLQSECSCVVWAPCTSVSSSQTCEALRTILPATNGSNDEIVDKLSRSKICYRAAI